MRTPYSSKDIKEKFRITVFFPYFLIFISEVVETLNIQKAKINI